MTTTEFFAATRKIGEMIVKNDLDFLLVITGRERIGKSTLALQIASIVDPDFKVDQIVFDIPTLYKKVYELNKGQVVIIDEGATAFFAREAMATDVREGVKLLTVMGERNLFVILCVPNFFIVDKYIRQNRVSALAKVVSRGRFKFFNRSALRAGHFNPKTKAYNWGAATFKSTYSEMRGKLWDDYCDMKSKYLRDRKTEYNENNDDGDGYEFLPKAAKIMHININALRARCNRKEIPGAIKNDANRWLIPIDYIMERKINGVKNINSIKETAPSSRVKRKEIELNED